MPDIPSKFQKDLSITFRVILLTDRQTKSDKNITSLAEVMKLNNEYWGIRGDQLIIYDKPVHTPASDSNNCLQTYNLYA